MTTSPGIKFEPASEAVAALRGGLVVSCQAPDGHPLAPPEIIAALARCAERGGAVAVRVESAADILATRRQVNLPIIGIKKVDTGGHRPFITPTLADCIDLARAGADIVALEASRDYRPDPDDLAALIRRVQQEAGRPVMADVSTLDEGLAAWAAGAELVATTLSGYTTQTTDRPAPDIELVGALSARGVRTVLEGRVRGPAQVRAAFEQGAWSVVVGTAITDPVAITAWYAAATPRTARR
jgi:N-acylglucosamine-6-phosphate 2-epimerase